MTYDSKKEAEFLQLTHKHQGIIHKICYLYCKSKADKDDMYQEIILQLWKSYSSFKSKSAFSTWMYRVALNTAITMTNKQKILIRSDKSTIIPVDLECTVGLSEDVKILYQAISKLKKIERGIVLLWLEEKSYEEIAETFGISVKNVSVRLVRLKAKLAEIIKNLQ
ncbi:MAG: RNA polymerase sigma factor [Bacteroidota bacterium]